MSSIVFFGGFLLSELRENISVLYLYRLVSDHVFDDLIPDVNDDSQPYMYLFLPHIDDRHFDNGLVHLSLEVQDRFFRIDQIIVSQRSNFRNVDVDLSSWYAFEELSEDFKPIDGSQRNFRVNRSFVFEPDKDTNTQVCSRFSSLMGLESIREAVEKQPSTAYKIARASVDGRECFFTIVFYSNSVPFEPIPKADGFLIPLTYMATPKDEISWTGDEIAGSWWPSNDETTFSIGQSATIVSSSSNDASLTISGFDLPSSTVNQIVIEMNSSAGTGIEVFWKTDQDLEFSQDRSTKIKTNTEQKTFTYELDLANHPYWLGTISELRIDPFNEPGHATISTIVLK